jgi:16S rRNA processing protein RimM
MKNVLVNQTPMEVERTWMHGDQLIFKFKGVETISDAERLAGAEVSIPFDQRPAAPEGEYYQSDLLGCEVFDPTGRLLGVVSDWQETAGSPLLEVRTPDHKEMLIPFAKSICTKIDPEQRRIEVTLPEGLEDLN